MAYILGRGSSGSGGGGPGSGVTSIAKSGDSGLAGAVTLSEGDGVTLTQVGQDIEVAASGGPLILSYVEQTTSDTSVVATSAATAELFVTAASVTVDGSTRIEVEFFCPQVCTPGGANARFTALELYWAFNGGAAAARGIFGLSYNDTSASRFDTPQTMKRIFTPAAGSYVFSIRAWVNAGTGQLLCGSGGAGTNLPAFIKVSTAP
jgi:hypothetical protein